MVWISQRLMGDDGWHETQLNEPSSILSFTKKSVKYMRYCRVESSKQSTYKINKQLLMPDDQMKDDWWFVADNSWFMIHGDCLEDDGWWMMMDDVDVDDEEWWIISSFMVTSYHGQCLIRPSYQLLRYFYCWYRRFWKELLHQGLGTILHLAFLARWTWAAKRRMAKGCHSGGQEGYIGVY